MLIATVDSQSFQTKQKVKVVLHKRKIYLKTGTFDNANIPIVVVFKALGIESDLEIFKLVGNEDFV